MAAPPASLGTVLGQEPPPASIPVRTARWRSGAVSDAGRDVPEETAIAFSYNSEDVGWHNALDKLAERSPCPARTRARW